MAVQRGDVPVTLPALIAGDVLDREFGPTFPDPPALAPDLTGVEARYDVAGRITQVPRTGAKGVLVGLAGFDTSAPPTTQTTYAVWLAADDPQRERHLVTALQHRGIVVTARDSIHDHETALSDEGPTLALRLALLAGIVSLVLAAFVLVVGIATSSISRARDLAGLRIVGVPARVIRSAAIREHVTVAALGTVAGVALGLAAAQGALPRLPLFARPGPRLPVTYEPAWSAVAIAGTTCLVAARARVGVRRPVAGRLGHTGTTEAGPMKRRMASAMIGLRLAVRGLWYRRSTTLIVLVLAVVASAAAVVAPLYSRAAEESIVRDTLQRADVFSLGVHVSRPQGDRQDPVDEQGKAPFRGGVDAQQVDASGVWVAAGCVSDARHLPPDRRTDQGQSRHRPSCRTSRRVCSPADV